MHCRRTQQSLRLACLGLLAVGALSGCYDPCENTVLSRHPDPTGQMAAVVFERDCGATTDYSTQIAVVASGDERSLERQTIFIADTNHGAAPSGVGGGPAVVIKWLSPDQIQLRYDPRARTYARVDSIDVRLGTGSAQRVLVTYGDLKRAAPQSRR